VDGNSERLGDRHDALRHADIGGGGSGSPDG
jgi:hypothetical protein